MASRRGRLHSQAVARNSRWGVQDFEPSAQGGASARIGSSELQHHMTRKTRCGDLTDGASTLASRGESEAREAQHRALWWRARERSRSTRRLAWQTLQGAASSGRNTKVIMEATLSKEEQVKAKPKRSQVKQSNVNQFFSTRWLNE